MKKTKVLVLAALTAIVTACGTLGQSGSGTTTGSILGSVLTDVLQGGTISNVITSVIGAQTVTANDLVGSWKYSNPGCAFTSDKLLAKAGGEVVAAEIKSKMLPYYQQIGINSQNTVITFNQDGTYSANFRGTPMSGKWTFDASTYKVTLSGMLLSINCYAKRNANGIALLFDASKLLTVLQTAAAMSGNSNIQAVGEISKSYDGVRLGFDFSK